MNFLDNISDQRFKTNISSSEYKPEHILHYVNQFFEYKVIPT